MKITVHELLGMIKDGKAPKKIKYDDRIWVKNSKNNDYTDSFGNEFFDSYLILVIIDDIVEILDKIEEKKIPGKLFFTHISNYNDQSVVNNNFNNYFKKTQETINQLIDYLKSKGE